MLDFSGVDAIMFGGGGSERKHRNRFRGSNLRRTVKGGDPHTGSGPHPGF